ncbi:helicase [Streptomyces sp. NRRL F-2747]
MWLANQCRRRDRLDAAQLEALTGLGMDWAR